mgnify:CR=1 FL=1
MNMFKKVLVYIKGKLKKFKRKKNQFENIYPLF